MDFYVNAKVFGTPFHLYCKEGENVEKVDVIPQNAWTIPSQKANDLASLYKFKLPHFPPKKYKKSFYDLVDKHTDIPWHHIIPEEEYKVLVRDYIEILRDFFSKTNLDYYENCFKVHNIVFNSLKPVCVNMQTFLANKENPAIKSFLPINGYAKNTIYDRTSSATGRLGVKQGPHILTVSKNLRNSIIKSRFGNDGKVYSFDYRSLEPRVLLSIIGKKNIKEDIYASINEEFKVNIPRKAIKIAIISRLYGAQNHTIEQQLKELVYNPQDLIKLIDEFFQINKAKEIIKNNFYNCEQNILYNLYKRPIRFEEENLYKILNYFIQSTSVDVALFGFSNIINKINAAQTDLIIPIFVLHDALLVDIHNKIEYIIPKIMKAGSENIPKFKDNVFYMTSEKMS